MLYLLIECDVSLINIKLVTKSVVVAKYFLKDSTADIKLAITKKNALDFFYIRDL